MPGSATLRTSESMRTPAKHCFPVWFVVPKSAPGMIHRMADFGTTTLDHLQPDCAGRKWSISLFNRMIHAPGRSAQRDHALDQVRYAMRLHRWKEPWTLSATGDGSINSRRRSRTHSWRGVIENSEFVLGLRMKMIRQRTEQDSNSPDAVDAYSGGNDFRPRGLCVRLPRRGDGEGLFRSRSGGHLGCAAAATDQRRTDRRFCWFRPAAAKRTGCSKHRVSRGRQAPPAASRGRHAWATWRRRAANCTFIAFCNFSNARTSIWRTRSRETLY
jgi:hypothetical protein